MPTTPITRLPILPTEAPTEVPTEASFDLTMGRHGQAPLRRAAVTTLQVNVGKLCNMACTHCHVEAGPKRKEIMPMEVAARVVDLLAANPAIDTLDLTGGAPELNPNFRWLVKEARARRMRVIDRCNLSVLFEPGMQDLASFLAAQGVEIVASLPCYLRENVDEQRGKNAFDKSIEALHRLNALGYGHKGSSLVLNLVYNPIGANLPPHQMGLEAAYKRELSLRFGVEFDHLLTLTNMPIKRFAHQLRRTGDYDSYVELLVNSFNPATVSNVMCRSMVSVGWDGALYDCDFNQMLEMPLPLEGERAPTIWSVTSLDSLKAAEIATGAHCFACTAGAGSSCGGALQ